MNEENKFITGLFELWQPNPEINSSDEIAEFHQRREPQAKTCRLTNLLLTRPNRQRSESSIYSPFNKPRFQIKTKGAIFPNGPWRIDQRYNNRLCGLI